MRVEHLQRQLREYEESKAKSALPQERSPRTTPRSFLDKPLQPTPQLITAGGEETAELTSSLH